MTGPAVVANGGVAPVTAGLNTVAAHSVAAVTLAAGDADTLLAAGCVVSPTVSQKVQEAAFLLHRNPKAS
jgi:hypothetical protein